MVHAFLAIALSLALWLSESTLQPNYEDWTRAIRDSQCAAESQRTRFGHSG